MAITIDELISERTKLKKDFDEMKQNITKVEFDLGAMKSNLNALNGAIQFASNLIMIADKKGESHRISSDEPEVSPIKKKVKKKKDEKI